MVAVAAAVSAALPARRALAQAAPVRLAALELVARGLPGALGRMATGAVRRAAAAIPRYRLGPPPALRLRQMLLALGCRALDAACLKKIGRHLEVDQILHGEIGRTATGYLLRVHLFDLGRGADLRSAEREVRAADGTPAFAAATMDATAEVLGEVLQLSVDSNVEGAIVLVNGQPVGPTPMAITEGLRAGTNEVIVRMSGYKDFVARVSLRRGKPMRLRAVLVPLAPPKPPVVAKRPPLPSRPPEPPRKKLEKERPFYARWWFWTIVGVVVGGGATAGAVLGTRGAASPTVGVEF